MSVFKKIVVTVVALVGIASSAAQLLDGVSRTVKGTQTQDCPGGGTGV